MASAPDRMKLDLAPQRAMFALEFRDPIRGGLVADRLRVAADGLRPPTVTPSNRFVWLDRGPPADRRIRVEAVSTDGRFAPFEEMIHVPAHVDGVPAAALIVRRRLRPTGLYEPPPGTIGVAGMLVEGGGSRAPVTDARIRINFRYAEGMETFAGGYTAFSDRKGGFAAVVRCLGDVRPDPDPRFPGTFQAWLRLKRGSEVRVSERLSLRLGRLIRLPALLEWAVLLPPEEQ
jgi:hypothetical protein